LNSFINIQVRILAQQAMRQVQQVQGVLNGSANAFSNASNASQSFGRNLGTATTHVTRFGSQMQWTGRQIEYNFTLPILAAGAAAMHFALQNEAAMVRVEKVYGDGSQSAQVMSNELHALERNFVALSNAFGVHRAEVIGIAADWAAAGASGIALAKATELTLQTMILGEMDAKKATEALIAIQAQYGQSTEELAKTLATLNMVENQTGISLSGLVDGFSRAAGVARSAGVDVRHLAAMLAALVPTTGSAAQAGNALKTIFSRLLSPTKEATEVLGLMGINIGDLQWKSSAVTDRLIIMAKAFEGLSDSQKGVVSSVIASRWQINKFEVLMRDMLDTNGFYARALKSTADSQALFTQAQRELNAVLSSNPRRLQMIWTLMQNAAADIIQPMIPFILSLAASVAVLLQKFSELDPGLQKLIIAFLLFVAVIGPVIRYIGATLTLVGSLGRVFAVVGAPIVWVTTALWGLVSVPVLAFLNAVGAGIRMLASGMMLLPALLARALAPLAVLGPRILAVLSASMSAIPGIVASAMAAVQVAIIAGARVAGGIWRVSLFLMATLTATVWGAIAKVTLAGVAAVQRAMITGALMAGVVWRSGMLGLALITQVVWMRISMVVAAATVGLQRIMITGALMAGVVWRSGMLGLVLITQVVWIAMQRAFAAGLAVVQGILIAGARVLGIVWRASLAALTVITSVTWAAIQRITAAAMATLRAIIWAGTAAIYAVMAATRLMMIAAWNAMMMAMAVLTVNWLARIKAMFAALPAFFRTVSTAIQVALTGPWGIAIALIIVMVVAFWDELKAIWRALVKGTIQAFNALPVGIRNAMMAVINVVRSAVMAVYNLFSWLNPWARHSPSLVENVTTGMDEISRQFARAKNAADVFRQAGLDLEEFGKHVRKLQAVADAREWAELRTQLSSIAPEAIPSFDRLVSVLYPLKDILEEINVELRTQQSVVDGLKPALDAANAAYDEQRYILDQLEANASALDAQLDAAKQRMQEFANAPIEGMKAMSDAIFANTMEQKRLQLELMKMEDAVGPLDQLQSRLNAINGEMELLRGEQGALRQAGAGSEILSQYDEQIDLLEQQQKQIHDQVKPLQDLSDAIDELGRKGQMLDLESSLKFDPLKRQIDDVVNSMNELPFEEILAGVTANRAEVDRLTEAYDKAKEAVDAQKLVVDQLEAARNALQHQYDLESAKLDEIKNQYQEVEDRIRSVEAAFRDLGQAAQAASGSYMSPGAENFLAAAGGNFPDPGGMGGVGREFTGIEDQSAMIDQFTKEIADKTKNMFGMFDFLDPIKRGWNKAMDWLRENIAPAFTAVGDSISESLGGLNPFAGAGTWIETGKKIFDDITGFLESIWRLIGPDVIKIFSNAWTELQKAFEQVQPEVQKFRELVGPIGEMFANIWTVLKPILAVLLGTVLLIIKVLLSMIAEGIGPFIKMVADIIGGIIKIIRGIIEVIVGVFTGDWEMAWQGVKDIFVGAWEVIWGFLDGMVQTLIGLIEGLVKGIWGFFKWLWDELVGHSIIPDLVNGITSWFQKMWDWAKAIWRGMGDAIIWVMDWIRGQWDKFVEKLVWAWSMVTTYINFIKSIFWGIVDAIAGVWPGFRGYIDSIVGYLNDMRRRFSFSGLFDGLKNAFKDAMNWIIGKWNNLTFSAGPFSIDTPNIPMMARGGVTSGVAIVGEGRAQYPEYVIPTDPNYRKRAVQLFADLGAALGVGKGPQAALLASMVAGQERAVFGQKVQMLASGGVVGRKFRVRTVGNGGTVLYAPQTQHAEYHFHGDLSFPNVSDGDDAEEFIKNLRALVGK
jgi:TP901 family phage tail tape measure protein